MCDLIRDMHIFNDQAIITQTLLSGILHPTQQKFTWENSYALEQKMHGSAIRSQMDDRSRTTILCSLMQYIDPVRRSSGRRGYTGVVTERGVKLIGEVRRSTHITKGKRFSKWAVRV